MTEKGLEILKGAGKKVFSGRFILTVTCAIIFARVCWNMKDLNGAALQIVTMVFTLYFTRNDRTTNQGGQQ